MNAHENFDISLSACRVNSGLSRADFSSKIGVSYSTLLNWETGMTEPTASQLRLISDISGIPMQYIRIKKRKDSDG